MGADNHSTTPEPRDGSEIAIIGLASRFPGAENTEAFWQNLCQGIESITPLSDDELKASGVPPALINDPHYVKAAPILDEVEAFDAVAEIRNMRKQSTARLKADLEPRDAPD